MMTDFQERIKARNERIIAAWRELIEYPQNSRTAIVADIAKREGLTIPHVYDIIKTHKDGKDKKAD